APPVVLASAAPTPLPDAPLAAAAVAAAAVEPPPAPVEEDIPLRLLSRVSPNVPRQLLAQNFRGGFAQVQFVVQPDGKVSQAQVIKASHARLGNAAIEAVQQWRFAPIPKAREAAVEVSFKADE
ncbi:MAG: TonB family protein, partial [Roseateles sp.]